MPHRSESPLRILIPALIVLTAIPARAQSPHASAGLQAIGLYTHADPIPGGGAGNEFAIVQPAIMLHAAAWGDRLQLIGTGNLEGLTIPDGELAPGDWGEGFVDRRHPHTYVHELMLSADDLLGTLDGAVRVSLSAGKGFAPFGTDDPMSRPVIRYPVNHHLAQILERAVAIVGVRGGPAGFEVALFNGDEPEHPGQWPRIAHRFGDSWSMRGTVYPATGLELQASIAGVHSPEDRGGAGPEDRKVSVSGRWSRSTARGGTYAMAEWARTTEADFYVYRSFLAEGAWSRGVHRLLWRVERTERPEEQRTVDPFRSVRPHLDNSIIAVTRWSIATAGYSVSLLPAGSRYHVEPQIEVAYAGVVSLSGPGFDPASFYGRDHIWSVNLGVRVGWGSMMHRMGRYGVMDGSDAMRQEPHSHMH